MAHLGAPLRPVLAVVRAPDQTPRIIERQRSKKHSVHHTEYGGSSAAPEPGNENHECSNRGFAPHPAKCITQVLCQISQPSCDPCSPCFFRCSCHIAKLSVRRRTCFVFVHAPVDQVPHHRFDVELHLFSQQLLPLVTIQPIPQAASQTSESRTGLHFGLPSCVLGLKSQANSIIRATAPVARA